MKSRGFTLLEVVISVAVISTIVSFVISQTTSHFQRGRDSARKTALNNLNLPLEQYYNRTGCYPQTLTCGQPLIVNGVTLLAIIPCDPKTGTSYYYESDGTSCSSWYKIYTNLEFDGDPSITFLGCQEGCGPSCLYNYGAASTNTRLLYCGEEPTPTPTQPVATNTPVPPTPTLSPTPTTAPAPTATPTPTPKKKFSE